MPHPSQQSHVDHSPGTQRKAGLRLTRAVSELGSVSLCSTYLGTGPGTIGRPEGKGAGHLPRRPRQPSASRAELGGPTIKSHPSTGTTQVSDAAQSDCGRQCQLPPRVACTLRLDLSSPAADSSSAAVTRAVAWGGNRVGRLRSQSLSRSPWMYATPSTSSTWAS